MISSLARGTKCLVAGPRHANKFCYALRRFFSSDLKPSASRSCLFDHRIPPDSTDRESFAFKAMLHLEKHRIRDLWTQGVRLKLRDRLERPRFSFPGVFDRAPPPPKTLHWRYAPAEGEYHKIRAMLCWASLHIWLIESSLASESPYWFLVDHSFDYLYNELVSKWLPEASIPSFSIKGEGKKLVDESRSIVERLDASTTRSQMMHIIWEEGFRDRGFEQTDPLFENLYSYIVKQRNLLSSKDVKDLIQDPASWTWDDTS